MPGFVSCRLYIFGKYTAPYSSSSVRGLLGLSLLQDNAGKNDRKEKEMRAVTKHREGQETNPGKPVTPASESVRRRAADEDETRRMMLNWAAWKSGVSISVAVSSAWDLEAKGPRAGTSVPLLNGEATDVDAAVEALPPELHQVIVEYWLKKGNSEKHARACRCAVRTFYYRLEHAHERIRALLQAKRDQAERARRNYQQLRAGTLVKSTA